MIHARPTATLRLQFHKDFTFDQARGLIPYFVKLGVSHIYSSPILTATPGSMHGYDVIDPTAVNPELGGEAALRHFVADLRGAGLGLIVDIVPNHMAVGASANKWWADVLKLGQASRYATFFDIDWHPDDPTLQGRVLAPFLGRFYGDAIDAGEITLKLDCDGHPIIGYFDNDYPIDPAEYAHIQEQGLESFDPAHQTGRELLHELLERQHYRLAWWGTAGDAINWRRFFDINGLAGLRAELPVVFEETHATLFRLYKDGIIDGFRIDHVDGLSDPAGYCRMLRHRLNELEPSRPSTAAQGRAYIVVEKILGAGEALPADWEVDGTSGYDFMNEVNAVQHSQDGAVALGQFWHDTTGRSPDFEPEEEQARREILLGSFDAQLRSLVAELRRIAVADVHTRDLTTAAIRRGVVELIAHFPAYRTYRAGQKRSPDDERAFRRAIDKAYGTAPASIHSALDALDRWLGGVRNDAYKAAQTKFQQLSAPIAAKAVEDTAFYRYGRLLSRNDVGFDATCLGTSVAAFHDLCLRRQASFPQAMLTTATHDHKRGEDLRARLAVISELPDEWVDLVTRLRRIPCDRPEPADELMLYQMVVGAWPPALSPDDAAGCADLAERLAGWQQKALREAKLRTSWTAPNENYETVARGFLDAVLKPGGPFLRELHVFIERIAAAGALNGLVQALLRMTVPGIPDLFQGTDFWDFSLVDPDNRRPVDYAARETALSAATPLNDLLSTWRDGQVKQSIIHAVLHLRREASHVFQSGTYVPLPVSEQAEEHVIAFARMHEKGSVIVIAPRLVAQGKSDGSDLRLPADMFSGMTVRLTKELSNLSWTALFGQNAVLRDGTLDLSSLLVEFPVAVLSSVTSS